MRKFNSSVLPASGSELDEERLARIVGGKPKKIIVSVCTLDEDGTLRCSNHEIDV